MTYPTIFERLRAMQPEESLSALIGEACDVGDELVRLVAEHPQYAADTSFAEIWRWLARKDAALAKARRCPDGECTDKCANGGAA